MIRSVTGWCVLGATVCLAGPSPVLGQGLLRSGVRPVSLRADLGPGEIHGIIQDDQGKPLTGAVVSALGETVAFALSDREGRYTFRSLPPGSYLVRVHLDGYVPPKGRYVQLNPGGRESWTISMGRAASTTAPKDAPPVVLSAVVGAPSADDDSDTETGTDTSRGESEIAWRLRNIRRGVLKDANFGLIDDEPLPPPDLIVRAGSPARLASALFADLNGQINLLTTTSFNRPQDLFSVEAGSPRPVAYVSIITPMATGDWTIRGSMTQGDISSWILAGAFARRGPATHQYEAGVSYATQRYEGGNGDALAAMRDGSRNAGELYASDSWTVTPRFLIGLGGRYASYAYLEDRALLSGRLSFVYQPYAEDPLRVSVSARHREIAPGAEEFVPPSVGLWLPPERTFSELARGEFTPERVNHVEVAGEREVGGGFVVGVRAFRQQIDDQLVTVFGIVGPQSAATLGHYHVGTAGNFETYGWGFSVTGTTSGATEASVAYMQVDSIRRGEMADLDVDALLGVSRSLLRRAERFHDLTASVRSRLAPTATRVFVVYKLNSAYAEASAASPLAGARFEVQINQEIPFLDFTGAQWEMLVGVRNLFRSDLFDGSVYDELLVVRPPKRVLGGVTVRF